MRPLSQLDPDTDCEEIVFRLGAWEFPWDIEKALEFALFRTYAVPSISNLLSRTGEFAERPRKRYDDTELILAEIVENGIESAQGQAALDRMNAMHGAYRIANSDMLYVLSTFVFEPPRWLARWGRRPLTEIEQDAIFTYYKRLGTQMGITDIPESRADFETFNRAYEAEHFRFADTNADVGKATRDLLLSFYLPRALFPVARPVAHALMDPPLRRAMGFADPPRLVSAIALGGMALRRRFLPLLPRRRRPFLQTKKRRPTYPKGYRIAELGTFPGARDVQQAVD
ncbi:MAG: oxygenase MpaB family protein [Pseudomonadota bacterium]